MNDLFWSSGLSFCHFPVLESLTWSHYKKKSQQSGATVHIFPFPFKRFLSFFSLLKFFSMHSLFSFENAMFQSPHWPLTSLIYLIHIIKNFLPTKITFSPITPNKLCFSEPPLYCYIDIFKYISCSFPFHMKEVQITDMICQLHGILRDASSFQLSILLSLCNVP